MSLIKTAVNTAQAASILTTLVMAHSVDQPLAPCLWGSPGIGKSQIVAQVAKQLGAKLIDVRAVLLDPVDLRGLPYLDQGRSSWAVPSFLPQSQELSILFLDELNRAPAMVQNACLQLILDRRLGEYVLPDNCIVIAACNNTSDGGGVQKMNSALCNRMIHFELEADLDSWCTWANTAGIDPLVLSFVRFRPELFHQFDRNAKAFPTPRSWEFVSRIAQTKADPALALPLYASAVGQGAAIEFAAFERMFRSLPSPDGILLNPTAAPVPTDPGALYAIATALGRLSTDQNFGRALQYIERMPREYGALAIHDATGRDHALTSLPEFTRSVVTHKWGQ